MQACVTGQFRVEGSCQQFALLGSNDPAVGQGREYRGVCADRLDDWGADEDGVIGMIGLSDLFERLNLQVGFERIDLATKGVALDGDVHQPK